MEEFRDENLGFIMIFYTQRNQRAPSFLLVSLWHTALVLLLILKQRGTAEPQGWAVWNYREASQVSWEETRPPLLAVQEYREYRTWAFNPGQVISRSDENAMHIPVLSYLKVMINLWSCTESAWKGSHTQDVRMALCHPQVFAFLWQPFPGQLH